MLERIHREQQDTQTYLKDMERHFHELEAIILRGKQQAVYNDEEVSGIGRVKQKGPWYLALPIPTLHCFTGSFTVLCRKVKMAGTAVTCRSSVSPVGNPPVCVSPCVTWSAALPR